MKTTITINSTGRVTHSKLLTARDVPNGAFFQWRTKDEDFDETFGWSGMCLMINKDLKQNNFIYIESLEFSWLYSDGSSAYVRIFESACFSNPVELKT